MTEEGGAQFRSVYQELSHLKATDAHYTVMSLITAPANAT